MMDMVESRQQIKQKHYNKREKYAAKGRKIHGDHVTARSMDGLPRVLNANYNRWSVVVSIK